MEPLKTKLQHDEDPDKSKNTSPSIKQESSCPFCRFKSDNETAFNQHLLKAHTVVLKSARNSIDYKLKNKVPRVIPKFKCKICHKGYPVASRWKDHQADCERKLMEKIRMAQLKKLQLSCHYCSDYFVTQAKLDLHLETCSKPKVAYCQLCSFECPVVQMSGMQKHIWNEHNLICKPVNEADFLQAVNRTPYTLERVPVLDVLPKKT